MATATQPVKKTPTAGSAAIRAEKLSKSYGRDVHAVDGVSFTVRPGEIFALLGPNGAGKSTTVRMLTTLSTPDVGEAFVIGYDVRRQPEQVRRAIGVVAQRSGIDPRATGRENLSLQGQIHSLRGSQLSRRVSELLEQFDLTGAADRLAGTYSGGMQRKLDIAMALIHRPRVLFLDEPTTGLDPESRATMWAELVYLAHNDRVTIFLTTHYMEEADHLAGRIAIIDGGRIVVEGSPDQLKNELRGDALHVELAGNGDTNVEVARRVLESIDGLGEIVIEGHSVHARASYGATMLPAVLAALDAAGQRAAAVTMARPSLDDVCLRYAGRTYRATREEGEL
jgi:ABC-2 type transport system ATP-binding protein